MSWFEKNRVFIIKIEDETQLNRFSDYHFDYIYSISLMNYTTFSWFEILEIHKHILWDFMMNQN